MQRPNPRGSTGCGQGFCLVVWQDWGGPDFADVMAAVDDAIARCWADADRLGVETQLVTDPDEHHSIARPSYQKDLYQRYLDWYRRWLE